MTSKVRRFLYGELRYKFKYKIKGAQYAKTSRMPPTTNFLIEYDT